VDSSPKIKKILCEKKIQVFRVLVSVLGYIKLLHNVDYIYLVYSHIRLKLFSIFSFRIMNIVILVSPCPWVTSTKSKPIHLNPQCNIKFSILINSTFVVNLLAYVLEYRNNIAL